MRANADQNASAVSPVPGRTSIAHQVVQLLGDGEPAVLNSTDHLPSSMVISFTRPVLPLLIDTRALGWRNLRAIRATSSAFALPSTGGALSRASQVPSSSSSSLARPGVGLHGHLDHCHGAAALLLEAFPAARQNLPLLSFAGGAPGRQLGAVPIAAEAQPVVADTADADAGAWDRYVTGIVIKSHQGFSPASAVQFNYDPLANLRRQRLHRPAHGRGSGAPGTAAHSGRAQRRRTPGARRCSSAARPRLRSRQRRGGICRPQGRRPRAALRRPVFGDLRTDARRLPDRGRSLPRHHRRDRRVRPLPRAGRPGRRRGASSSCRAPASMSCPPTVSPPC